MTNSVAKPMSTKDICNIAMFVRKCMGVDSKESLDVVKALDLLFFKFSKYDFDYRIIEDDNPCFEPNEEAKTDIVNGVIYIKESIFNEACTESGSRSRFTIAHEIGHFVLHHALNMIDFSRTSNHFAHKIYEDPEWQADTFAGEFLMPTEACKELSPTEIQRRYHVSKSAAETKYWKINPV